MPQLKAEEMSYEGRAVLDARPGGLIIGPPHWRGGVNAVEDLGHGLRVIAELEGGEYVVSAECYRRHRARIEDINGHRPFFARLSRLDISSAWRVMDVGRAMATHVLLMGERDQFVVNKRATARYLAELDRLHRNL